MCRDWIDYEWHESGRIEISKSLENQERMVSKLELLTHSCKQFAHMDGCNCKLIGIENLENRTTKVVNL